MIVTLAPMPTAMRAAWVPTTPPPSITTSAGGTPGTPPSRTPAPTLFLLQAMGAGLDRHAARDLAHRREKRQAAARIGHGLVGDGNAAGIDQRVGLDSVGREVEIGEQHLIAPQHGALRRLGLLHLHDHLRGAVDLSHLVDHLGTRPFVVLVEEPDFRAGIPFDHDPVAVLHELAHPCRRNADAIFVNLGFLGNADQHGRSFPNER